MDLPGIEPGGAYLFLILPTGLAGYRLSCSLVSLHVYQSDPKLSLEAGVPPPGSLLPQRTRVCLRLSRNSGFPIRPPYGGGMVRVKLN
jgi:hypothetical protein